MPASVTAPLVTPKLKVAPDRRPLPLREGILFFWGGWPSNWEPSWFEKDGVSYNCVEQWMMAAKARLFGDEASLRKIMASPFPKAQKEAGRGVRGYDDATWARLRYAVVLEGTREKYGQHDELRALLLATGDAEIVEASPYDDVWGIGIGETDRHLLDRSRWGQNLLGKAIMAVRAELATRDTP